MVAPANTCRRFQANIFSKIRCQNCFKPKGGHSDEALESAKMSRKVTACGFLYVAPPNIDFSQSSHSIKRWQRRYFTLYDDGELSYAIDDNPETVPQVVMNMIRCTRICEADAITAHAHSILLAFEEDDADSNCAERHLPVCYIKADTTEEIRRWQHLLQMCAKQNVVHFTVPARKNKCNLTSKDDHRREDSTATVIQVNDSSLRGSPCSSRSSSNERQLQESPLVTRIDLGNKPTLVDSHHGTPRSVKYRSKANKEEVPRKPMSDAPNTSETPPPLPDSPCPVISSRKPPNSMPFNIDTSNVHTLRKGWLLLRGRNESEWIKHWAVLGGLSLKLYKDVWAEQSSDPLLSIDLTECENVYPSAAARNYGIEIKCRKTRYILSAMTPGIRDSWIAALQQNMHNPSPTYAETFQSDAASLPDTDLFSLFPRKKRIAYVAPESHHSSSMMDEESCSDDELNSIGSRVNPSRQMSASERSAESSEDELLENEQGEQRSSQRRRGAREQSLSPTVRRSPVTRIKERSNTRQQFGPLRRYGSFLSLPCVPTRCERTQNTSSTTSTQGSESASAQEMRFRSLEFQVESLRDQLHDATCLLGEAQAENERLRYLFMSSDARSLSQLRKSLAAAEQDLMKKQEEIESLRRQLITPTNDADRPLKLQKTIVERLISLLKMQVGTLSKFVHTNSGVGEHTQLRQTTDRLIRSVAALDDTCSKSPELDPVEAALEQVSEAYQQLSSVLNIRQPETREAELNTEIDITIPACGCSDGAQDLEDELEELQAAHAEELESLRLQYENQVKSLREMAEYEKHRRKKAQEELQTLNAMNDHSLSAMKKTHEEMLAEQLRHFEEEIKILKEEHSAELQEEKEATRLALDAVQRSHEAEVKSMAEKLRALGGSLATCQASTSAEPRYECQSARQSKMFEQMSAELSQLSALYSAKCLENSQLDEKMSALLADKENQSSSNDAEMHNRRLIREIRQKDITIEELRQKIISLEKKLSELKGEVLEKKESLPQRNREPRRCIINGLGIGTAGAHSITITSPTSSTAPPCPEPVPRSPAAPESERSFSQSSSPAKSEDRFAA